MRKNNEISHSSKDKMYMFKVYTVKSNYAKYITKEVLDTLVQLKGKLINDIPFVRAYLGQGSCRLEKISLEGESVYCELDFEREKIVHENNMPLRIIYHHRVELIYYYKNETACIYEPNDIKDNSLLSIIAALFYWAILRTYSLNDIHYTKTFIKEITIDLINSFELFRSFLLQYIEPRKDDGCNYAFDLNEEWLEKSKKRNVYEIKLLRKKHLKYSYMIDDGKKHNVIIKSNAEVKSTIPLSRDIITRIVNLLNMLAMNVNLSEFPSNIEATLEEGINYISKDMREEFKVKKKLNVIDDLKKLIAETLKNDIENIDVNILNLSLYMDKLIFTCRKGTGKWFEKISVDVIEYDALCSFLKLYIKEKYHVNLTEEDLLNGLCRFFVAVRESKGNLTFIDKP